MPWPAAIGATTPAALHRIHLINEDLVDESYEEHSLAELALKQFGDGA